MEMKNPHRRLLDALSQLEPAEWLKRMQRDFERTGKYRHQDLTRLLGDQTASVSVGEGVVLPLLRKE